MVLARGWEGVAKNRQESLQGENRSGRVESRRMARFNDRVDGSVGGDPRRGVGEPVSVPDLSGEACAIPATTPTFLGQPRPPLGRDSQTASGEMYF